MQSDLEKIKHYCAYSERCHSEVRHKLLALKVYGSELENIMTVLIEENFLNEERYACAVARGKFNLKKWGRNKIRYYLKSKNISDYLVKKALEQIDDDLYLETLADLAEKKITELSGEKNAFARSQKAANYLLQKGYENDMIYGVLKKYL